MIQRTGPRAALMAALLCLGVHDTTPAQSTVRPERRVVQNVRLAFDEEAPLRAIVIHGGRIEAVLDAGAATPAGARALDGEGYYATPAFVDAYTRTGCETPQPVADQDAPPDVRSDVRVDMREAGRKGIQPAFRAADVLALSESEGEAWRSQGFGALLASPARELLAGTSVLAVTRDAPRREVVLLPEVFAHAAFAASGGGYPSTLMGYHAQLRQFFLDAGRHAELQRRADQGRPGPRPPWDPELEAGVELLARGRRVVCEAETARDIERWIKLADAFGLDIAISGGRDAWKVADTLAVRRIPVLLTLDWGDEVEDPLAKEKKKKKKKKEGDDPGAEEPEATESDPEAAESDPEAEPAEEQEPEESAGESWEYEEPLAVRVERRREWEERRDGVLLLEQAGVRFAFGTGRGKPAELLKNVRTLVELGLPAEAARAALSTGVAELLGAGDRLGRIEPGLDATFAVWTGDPLDGDSQLAWLFVDGVAHEFEVKEDTEAGAEGPDEGVDATGTWAALFEADDAEEATEATLELEMAEDGTVTGEVRVQSPFGDDELRSSAEGRVSGARLVITSSFSLGEMTMDVRLDAELEGDQMKGEVIWKAPWGEENARVTANRRPDHSGHSGRSEETR